MDFKTQLLLNKVESFAHQESTKSKFAKEHREEVIKITKEAINNNKIKRLNDLKNFIHSEFGRIAKKESIEF